MRRLALLLALFALLAAAAPAAVVAWDTPNARQSADIDGDGAPDNADNCMYSNPDQADGDGDGVGDLCDKPALSQYKLKPVRGGLKVSFRLSEKADVTLTVYKKRPRRYVYYFDLPKRKGTAGANSFTIKYPKFKGKPLAPGVYGLAVGAVDEGFEASGLPPKSFTIKAPRR